MPAGHTLHRSALSRSRQQESIAHYVLPCIICHHHHPGAVVSYARVTDLHCLIMVPTSRCTTGHSDIRPDGVAFAGDRRGEEGKRRLLLLRGDDALLRQVKDLMSILHYKCLVAVMSVTLKTWSSFRTHSRDVVAVWAGVLHRPEGLEPSQAGPSNSRCYDMTRQDRRLGLLLDTDPMATRDCRHHRPLDVRDAAVATDSRSNSPNRSWWGIVMLSSPESEYRCESEPDQAM
ncbi:hypothetical protein C8Q74DRAFT_1256312 [Fomes fomentarius]|nr:hypothetical protein C8Q74DRAFT_1256312 [Fomes fomentarius]